MFTGIVEAKASIVSIDHNNNENFAELTVDCPGITDTLNAGDSLSVNGVCLTDAGHRGTAVVLQVMGETLNRTALGELEEGDEVNVERALRADARLGGHIVQGHVDGTGRLLDRQAFDKWEVFRFSLPTTLAGYVVEKGSIAVSGTSLTVSQVSAPEAEEPWFEVSLIPTTLSDTILGEMKPGASVNLEVDILAKYIERLVAVQAAHTNSSAPENIN